MSNRIHPDEGIKFAIDFLSTSEGLNFARTNGFVNLHALHPNHLSNDPGIPMWHCMNSGNLFGLHHYFLAIGPDDQQRPSGKTPDPFMNFRCGNKSFLFDDVRASYSEVIDFLNKIAIKDSASISLNGSEITPLASAFDAEFQFTGTDGNPLAFLDNANEDLLFLQGLNPGGNASIDGILSMIGVTQDNTKKRIKAILIPVSNGQIIWRVPSVANNKIWLQRTWP
jgi:hypothetical protein